MLRYISLVWNENDSEQQHAAESLINYWKSTGSRWHEVLAADGLIVLCTGEAPNSTEIHRLQDRRGIVLGTLFKRARETEDSETIPLHGALEPAASADIVKTEGRELVDSYWGSYVAIMQDIHKRKTWILRSPVGTLPCFSTLYRKIQIYFSFIPDCASCGLLNFTVSWKYVARHLGKMRQSGDTGLNEVSEIRYGECVEISRETASRLTRQYWSALDAARAESIADPIQAVTAVRHTVRMCVQAWAACHKTIVLRLSGGLDSAVVLSCLRDAPSRPHVICVNRYSLRSDSDEREFARLAVRNTGYELLELKRDPEFRLEDIFSADLAERPRNYLGELGQALPEVQFARDNFADAIFSGGFGDQLFYAGDSTLTAADHIHDCGIRPSSLAVVFSAARTDHLSVWKVLTRSMLKGLFRHRWDPINSFRAMNVLINEDVLRNLMGSVAETHPWYQPDRYVPPGKQFQISGLMDSNPYYMSFESMHDLPWISPLLSQPLVELCLRIPTYVLSHGGWDRQIERRAFKTDIPEEIARRRSKGGQADFTAEIAKRNHAFVRDALLSGGLVGNGLLDKEKLEEALAGRSAGLYRGPARVSRVLNIEVWLKSWASRHLQLAA